MILIGISDGLLEEEHETQQCLEKKEKTVP